METALGQLAPMFIGLGVVGTLMVHLSTHYGRLESRRAERRCPACGRRIEGRVCRRCAGECA
jgi:hypothetical protein